MPRGGKGDGGGADGCAKGEASQGEVMKDVDLNPLFTRSDSDELLHSLWECIERKSNRLQRSVNDSQRFFFLAWEAVEVLNGDGFRTLLGLDFALNDYAESLVKIGMPELGPIFDRVDGLIPTGLRSPEKTSERLAFLLAFDEELDNLLREFLEASKDVIPIMCSYVREHRGDFADFIDG